MAQNILAEGPVIFSICLTYVGGLLMKYFINYFKGVIIGLATLVPGVSGGTMAVILGLYDDLIHSISSFFQDWKNHTLLLLQVGLGALSSLLLFSRLLETILASHPHVMGFLFLGVICGGVPVLYKKASLSKENRTGIFYLLIGFLIVTLMSWEPSATTALATSDSFISIVFLFIAGIIMAVALILPGISGSFMLLTLGLYNVTLNAINNINITFLIPLLLGIAVGTLATTKIIENLLKKYPNKSYMLILGFVIGSLPPVFPGIPKGFTMIFSLLAFLTGFLLIRFISKRELIQ